MPGERERDDSECERKRPPVAQSDDEQGERKRDVAETVDVFPQSRRHEGDRGDRDRGCGDEGAQTALKMGAVDSIVADAVEAAKPSDVIVLAVPIYATLDWMEQLAGVLGPDQLVTDVGSTKGDVVADGIADRGDLARGGNPPPNPPIAPRCS